MIVRDLKKGDRFIFNETIYTVQQRFSYWKRGGEPYMVTVCGQVFWYDELEVQILTNNYDNGTIKN